MTIDNNQELDKIVSHINEKRGLDFSGYRASMIERRIGNILSALNRADFREYLTYLAEHPEELNNI